MTVDEIKKKKESYEVPSESNSISGQQYDGIIISVGGDRHHEKGLSSP